MSGEKSQIYKKIKMVKEITLDPQIRDWVLIPIMVVMFLVSILRHNITKLMRSEPKKGDLKNIQESQALLRARRLRTNANKIPLSAFNARKIYFNNKENGIFREREVAQTDPMANAMANPMMVIIIFFNKKKEIIK